MRLRIMAMHDTTVELDDNKFQALKESGQLQNVVEKYVRLTPLELTYGPEDEFNGD